MRSLLRLILTLSVFITTTCPGGAQDNTEVEALPVEKAIEQPVSQPAVASPQRRVPSPAATTAKADYRFEFHNAPVQAVLEHYANLARRSIISAPNLAGVVTFTCQTELTVDEAKAALESVLAINGIAVIPLGEKFLKVVQIATAKQEGLPFMGEGKEQPAADAMMTQVISLKYAEPNDVVAALQPYLHAYGQLLPLPKSGCVLVTETAANVNQMLEIVKYIDVPSALRMETRVFTLTHAKAAEVMQRLQSIIQETQQLGARASAPGTPPVPIRPGAPVTRPATPATTGGDDSLIEGKVIITADDRTNKIFILSRASNFVFFEKMISELDGKVEPDMVMKVIALDYAPAEDTASLVNSLITGGQPTFTRRTGTTTTSGRPGTIAVAAPPIAVATAAAAGGSGDAGFLQFAQGVRILPDPRTNSLLVMATKEDLARIEQMIKSLDTAVAQVLVEVVIAEVNLGGSLEVGVEAFKRVFQEGQVIQGGGTKMGQPNPPQDLSDELSDIDFGPALLSGAGGLTYFTTFKNLKLDAVIRLLSTSSKFKVLSTPVIQTLHNQEANIVVGESRPIITSTVSDISGAVVNNQVGTAVRSNVEYKDIAIELKVIPRINPDGYVTMEIEQKVNDVQPGNEISVSGTPQPIITKREAKSSIAVRNQSTIVLGGLIQENKSLQETKVPFLGDIPFLGTLFKGKKTDKRRTELIVFIRPTVLRSDKEAVAEARHRVEKLQAGKELELKRQFWGETDDDAAGAAPDASTTATGADRAYGAKVKALEEQTQERLKPTEN